MRYQIVDTYIVAGRKVECLADTPTASGNWFICYNKEQAEKRVAELRAMGRTKARYEELPFGEAWFDDSNWNG